MHKEEIKVFSFLFGGILMIISSSRIYGILIKTAQRPGLQRLKSFRGRFKIQVLGT